MKTLISKQYYRKINMRFLYIRIRFFLLILGVNIEKHWQCSALVAIVASYLSFTSISQNRESSAMDNKWGVKTRAESIQVFDTIFMWISISSSSSWWFSVPLYEFIQLICFIGTHFNSNCSSKIYEFQEWLSQLFLQI